MRLPKQKHYVVAFFAVAVIAFSTTSLSAPLTVFSTDFDAGVPSQVSGVTTTESVQGFEGRGTGSNVFFGTFIRNITGGNPTGTAGSPTVLTLTGLPAHDSVDLHFLLAIVDTWDGSDPGSGINQPDYFNVTVDGHSIFRETIDHEDLSDGTYSNPAPGVLVAWGDLFSAGIVQNDIGFNMGLEPAFNAIPHSGSVLTVKWFADGAGWQGNTFENRPTDETWAIDNVAVILNGTAPITPVPEPTTLALLGIGLAGLGFSRRKQ